MTLLYVYDVYSLRVIVSLLYWGFQFSHNFTKLTLRGFAKNIYNSSWYSDLCFNLRLTAWLCLCLGAYNWVLVHTTIFNPLAWLDGVQTNPHVKNPLQLYAVRLCRVRRWYSGVRCSPVRLIVRPPTNLHYSYH